MASNTLAISLTIPADVESVWQRIGDWESQGEWMLQTKVWVTSDKKEGIGTSIAAFTGPLYFLYPRFRKIGLLDLMVVTNWQPPHRCDVEHVGKILKGTGSFQLKSVSSNETRFDWSETIESPRWIFLLARPFFHLGVRLSLARFARSFT
ncbi:MAG: hypothetical protein RL381_156 [Actinomycetota bacterium]|jgi:hypothetical protein